MAINSFRFDTGKLSPCLLIVLTLFFPVSYANTPFTIVLDSGHHPKQQGALGIRGIYEVTYNDQLTARVTDALKKAGMLVVLTRSPTQDITLEERANVGNSYHADLFLAIHHDSAQQKYLKKLTIGQLNAYGTLTPLSGYSLFVSTHNTQFNKSKVFATLLGQQLRQQGRWPSWHHAEAIPGENRLLLDKALGIYQFDDLIVLKKTTAPAVLFEAGVIVDQADEEYLRDENKQNQMVNAIVAAVQAYQRRYP